MFDCRVDSDALFHQHGVSLRNVFDVQLADIAARRRNHHAVSLLSGMPKCAARWLPKGANQAEANLAANDGKGGFDPSAPPDAVSIARVTEYLKRKVKEQYASNLGGDGELWARRPLAEDVRRYAALDAWLLKEIYAAMEHGAVLDEDWRVRVVKESDRRVGEYRDLTEPIMQFRSQERAQAPDL
jgi:exonuclease 3'-5' domain-containing protein 1